MTSPKYARGAHVVVRPPDDVPELVEIAGRTGLVVDTTHPEHPEATVLSLDASPGAIVLVDQAWLAPVDDKPCVTLDPRCCALLPCAGCLVMFQAHLRAALTVAEMSGDQGMRFVTEWNAQRERGRAQSLDLVRQARAYAVAEAERRASKSPEEREQAETLSNENGLVAPPEMVAEVVSPQAKSDGASTSALEGDVDRSHRDPPPALSPSDSPQVIPSEGVEKKGSTKRRKPAKTAAPSSADRPAPSDLGTAAPSVDEGVPGEGEAAG